MNETMRNKFVKVHPSLQSIESSKREFEKRMFNTSYNFDKSVPHDNMFNSSIQISKFKNLRAKARPTSVANGKIVFLYEFRNKCEESNE